MGFQFGVVDSISTETGTICLICVAMFLVAFEYLTSFIELLRDGFPATYQMIQKIFKELMIMGLVSFSVVMYETSEISHQNISYINAIDFAHILLFFMALFYVLHAFLLIRLSGSASEEYTTFHFNNIEQILKDVTAHVSVRWRKFFYHIDLIPGSRVRDVVEFKMLHIFFKETYKFSNAFDFSVYLTGCFEAYALELLEVGVFTWVSVIVVASLNLARIQIMKDADVRCALPRKMEEASHAGRRFLEGNITVIEHELHGDPSLVDGTTCTEFDLTVFVLGGVLMCVITIIVNIAARIYEIRLIRKTGAKSVADYERVLLAEAEKIKIEASAPVGIERQCSTSHLEPFSVEELQRNIDMLEREERAVRKSYWRRLHMIWRTLFEIIQTIFVALGIKKARTPSSSAHNNQVGRDAAGREFKMDEELGPPEQLEGVAGDDKDSHKSLSEIFLFGNRYLFFRSVEFVVMLNCLYMALWATSFVSVAMNSTSPVGWEILVLLPIGIMFPTLGQIVRTSSKILAIEELNVDVIGKMIEDEEENAVIVAELRSKLTARFSDMGHSKSPQEVVQDIFQKIDSDGNDLLSKRELRKFLRALHLHYSDDKFNRLFKTIDKDHSGDLTIKELSELLFPDAEQERRRRAEEEAEAKVVQEQINMRKHVVDEMEEKDMNMHL